MRVNLLIPLTILWYLPLFPFVTRAFILVPPFRHQLAQAIPPKQLNRDEHRTVILALAGFSFSGAVALAVVALSVSDAKLRNSLQLPVFYLLISFLCYFFALNLQGYKSHWWHDVAGEALADAASLSLVLSIIVVVRDSYPNSSFGDMITVLALVVWLVDHAIRVQLWKAFLRQLASAPTKQAPLPPTTGATP